MCDGFLLFVPAATTYNFLITFSVDCLVTLCQLYLHKHYLHLTQHWDKQMFTLGAENPLCEHLVTAGATALSTCFPLDSRLFTEAAGQGEFISRWWNVCYHRRRPKLGDDLIVSWEIKLLHSWCVQSLCLRWGTVIITNQSQERLRSNSSFGFQWNKRGFSWRRWWWFSNGTKPLFLNYNSWIYVGPNWIRPFLCQIFWQHSREIHFILQHGSELVYAQ